MNNENTATALAISETGNIEHRSAVRLEWSPESLAHQIENEKQMRLILKQYMQGAMIKDIHYYSFKEGDRPALTQEGAHSLCSLMKCVIGPPTLERHFDGDHLTVSARVEIFNQNGERIATGDGMCSTRESKYAYRWAYDNELAGTDTTGMKFRSGQKKNGGTWTQYQVPNQDLPDLYNTVLKMAVKRAKVAGVRQLPLVSELFTPDDLEPPAEPLPVKRKAAAPAVPAPAANESPVDVVIKLVQRLIDRGISPDDLAAQFLPDGVMFFTELTDEQAAAIRPGIVELLNAQVKAK